MNLDLAPLNLLAQQQKVDLHVVTDVIADALTAAYGRRRDAVPGAVASVDPAAGTLTIHGPDGADVTPADLGRLAADATRQGVQQWLRDLQRRRAVGVWADHEGSAVVGTVRLGGGRRHRGGTALTLSGGTDAVLPDGESVDGESLRDGQMLSVYVLNANVDDRGRTLVTVSRRQPSLVTALFAQQVPQVASGQVSFVAIARDPGVRTKVAVSGENAKDHLTGAGATRIRPVVEALGGERVDLVEHSADLATYVAAALTPGRVSHAEVLDPTRRTVRVHVTGEQMALVRGRADANVRLAMRLTGARIEVALVA